MNEFIHYTRRLEQAGIWSLWISLGSDAEGHRLMHVSPSETVDRELAQRFPTRTFRIDGSDPILQACCDEIAFNDATAEQVEAMCAQHPERADELRDWYKDWNEFERATDEEIAAEEVTEDDKRMVERTVEFTKGLIRGMSVAREHDALRGGKGE